MGGNLCAPLGQLLAPDPAPRRLILPLFRKYPAAGGAKTLSKLIVHRSYTSLKFLLLQAICPMGSQIIGENNNRSCQGPATATGTSHAVAISSPKLHSIAATQATSKGLTQNITD